MRERNINTTNHQGKLERELSCVERDREIEEKMNGGESYGAIETQYIRRHHKHEPRENQCTSALVKHIRAPVHLVSLFFYLKLFGPISCFLFCFSSELCVFDLCGVVGESYLFFCSLEICEAMLVLWCVL